MSRFIGVASVQITAVPNDVTANVNEIENFVKLISLTSPFVNIIIFPELCIQGFSPDYAKFAEQIPGPTTDRLRKIAKEVKKWIIPGSMFEKGNDDYIYNSMVLISPEGDIVEKYRKMFPWSPLEPSHPGDKFSVAELPGIGKIGMCICYDMMFPEVVRTLVSMGAEVIIHPTMTPAYLREQERVANRANALFNQVYFVGSSICGQHGYITCAGHSMIVDPEGTVMQEAGDTPEVLIEILDLDKVTMVRKYGTKGAVPMLRHLKYYDHKFPVYANQQVSGPGFDNLDPIAALHNLPNKIKV